jgi:hypothetical protein
MLASMLLKSWATPPGQLADGIHFAGLRQLLPGQVQFLFGLPAHQDVVDEKQNNDDEQDKGSEGYPDASFVLVVDRIGFV